MERLKRSAENDSSAQAVNITDNYTRDYQAIFANRVGSSENAKAAVRGLGGNRYKVNNIANALNIVSAGGSGYAQGESLTATRNAKNKNN